MNYQTEAQARLRIQQESYPQAVEHMEEARLYLWHASGGDDAGVEGVENQIQAAIAHSLLAIAEIMMAKECNED
jgi:hypothetical protein